VDRFTAATRAARQRPADVRVWSPLCENPGFHRVAARMGEKASRIPALRRHLASPLSSDLSGPTFRFDIAVTRLSTLLCVLVSPIERATSLRKREQMKRSAAVVAVLVALSGHPVWAGQSRHLAIRKTPVGVRGALHSDRAICTVDQIVKVQKKRSSGWNTIARTRTDGNGAYRKQVSLAAGNKYRTVAPESTAGSTTCQKTVSRTVIG
jgi:hypothetical protein